MKGKKVPTTDIFDVRHLLSFSLFASDGIRVRVSGGGLLRDRFECTLNAACMALISCVTLAAPAKIGPGS